MRLIFILLFGFLLESFLIASIAIAEPRLKIKYAGISEYQLENGLKILLMPDMGSAKITVNVTYLVGSRHESYGETGMAHLLEHLVFKNTKKYSGKDGTKTPVQILNELGGNFNGTTSLDRTNYFISIPASDENLDLILSLESERMGNSLLDPNDLWDKTEKRGEMTVVRNEFEIGENNPLLVTYKRLLGTAYDWHNYGHPTIGSRSDIENVGIDSIRSFYERYYQPDNAVILLAGRFEEKKALEIINKYFSEKSKPTRLLPETYTRESPQDGERRVTVSREGDVPLLLVGYKTAPSYGKEGAAMKLLIDIMTNQTSGRLTVELIKKKLATQVFHFSSDTKEPGLTILGAFLPSDGNLDLTEKQLTNTLESIQIKKISEEEVRRSKISLLADWEQMLSKTDEFAIQMSEFIALGDWRLFFVYRELLETVTKEDVQAVAEKYFRTSNRTVARFVPKKSVEKSVVADHEPLEPLIALLKPDEGEKIVETVDLSPLAIEKKLIRKNLTDLVKIALFSKETRRHAVSGKIALRFGNEQDLSDKAITAFVTSQLLRRGSSSLTRQQIDEKLDELQSSLEVTSEAGVVYLAFETKKDHLKELLDLSYQILMHPTFPQDEIERFIAEQKTSKEHVWKNPDTLVREMLSKQLRPYPKNHILYPMSTAEFLDKLTKLKRSELVDFHQRLYGGPTEIALVGDFDANEAPEMIHTKFVHIKIKKPYKEIEKRFFPSPGISRDILTPGKANAYLEAGLNLNLSEEHPDYPALLLGNYMLGGGTLRNRLADRIRQKEGLSYHVSSSLRVDPVQAVGRWEARAMCNPMNADKVEKALKEEIKRVIDNGFTKDELDYAKNSFKQAMAIQRSKDRNLTSEIVEQIHLGRTWTFQNNLEAAIDSLSLDHVSQSFRKYIEIEKISFIKGGDFKKG